MKYRDYAFFNCSLLIYLSAVGRQRENMRALVNCNSLQSTIIINFQSTITINLTIYSLLNRKHAALTALANGWIF